MKYERTIDLFLTLKASLKSNFASHWHREVSLLQFACHGSTHLNFKLGNLTEATAPSRSRAHQSDPLISKNSLQIF